MSSLMLYWVVFLLPLADTTELHLQPSFYFLFWNKVLYCVAQIGHELTLCPRLAFSFLSTCHRFPSVNTDLGEAFTYPLRTENRLRSPMASSGGNVDNITSLGKEQELRENVEWREAAKKGRQGTKEAQCQQLKPYRILKNATQTKKSTKICNPHLYPWLWSQTGPGRFSPKWLAMTGGTRKVVRPSSEGRQLITRRPHCSNFLEFYR